MVINKDGCGYRIFFDSEGLYHETSERFTESWGESHDGRRPSGGADSK